MKRIVTFGEIMMRLNPEGYRRFVQADKFEASYAGGEANVAVSLANYGNSATFVTKVPHHEIGQCAVNALRHFGVDTDKVIKMCLVHDFGEAVTGDIPSFQKSEKDIAREDDAVLKLIKTLPTAKKDEIAGLFEEMAERKTIEAKVWRALDMLEAVISHNEADISTWIPIEYDLQQTYGIEESKCHPALAKLRAQVLADTLEKIEREGER